MIRHPALRVALAILAVAAILWTGSSARAAEPGDQEILVMLDLPPPHFGFGGSYLGSYTGDPSAMARKRLARRIARDDGLELVDSWPMPLVGIDCYVMRVPGGVSVEDAIVRVSKHRDVKWSQPLNLYRAQAQVAGDPLLRAAPAATEWHLSDLHRLATGKGVRIAVIDSRIDVRHPDLSGQFTVAKDFVTGRSGTPELHGTGVAGVIGAKENNGIGIAGVAPGARMMALRACWQAGPVASATLCDSLSLAKALEYAVEQGAQVVNLSLSGPADLLLGKLISIALARHMSIVAAYDPALPEGGFPASQRGVIAVAEEPLRRNPGSLYSAPGRNIPTTQPGDTWNFVSGSSYAAAHVSGLVALERQERGRTAAISFARLPNGSIDACGSLAATAKDCNCDCAIDRALSRRR